MPLLLLLAAGVGFGVQPIVYDDDDRIEVAALDPEDPRLVTALDAVAAIVTRDVSDAPTWREQQNLCDGVRFAEQTVVADCTAVLVTADLVLTAAHCARLCSRASLVFGLYEGAATQETFACVDVVADERTPAGVDVAWLRLDRPTERLPAALAASPVAGDRLALFGFFSGLPMKADPTGEVTSIDGAVFRTNHDAFSGASGGPLLDDRGHVVGILGGGATDLIETPEGCAVPNVISSTVAGGLERATDAVTALDVLCLASPGETLCAPSGCSDAGRGRSSARPTGLVLVLFALICAGRDRSRTRG